MNIFKKLIEVCGFYKDAIDDEDVCFVPVSSSLGKYIMPEDLMKMEDEVIAVEFIPEGVVELYRIGLKKIKSKDSKTGFSIKKGIWPLNNSPFARDVGKYSVSTYGKEWRAFHVDLPINAKDIGVMKFVRCA